MYVSLCSLSVIICASNNIHSAKYSYYFISVYEVGFKPKQHHLHKSETNTSALDLSNPLLVRIMLLNPNCYPRVPGLFTSSAPWLLIQSYNVGFEKI